MSSVCSREGLQFKYLTVEEEGNVEMVRVQGSALNLLGVSDTMYQFADDDAEAKGNDQAEPNCALK